MSKALICDRCGYIRNDSENSIFGRITLNQTRGNIAVERFLNKDFDLCANCMYELETFLDEKKVNQNDKKELASDR